jgi:hypothetical protein
MRLVWIELRRSTTLWYVPALAVLAIWGTLTTMRPDEAPTLWARSSIQLSLMFVVVAFIMSGIGAWAAGRERRRQTRELLATTPRPAVLRDLALFASTALWGLVACLASGAYVFMVTSREATWGGPDFAPILVGLLMVVASTAIGYLGGTLIPGRFAAPLVAVAWSSAALLVGTRSSAVAYLSPMSIDPRGYSPSDLFYQAPSIPAAEMSIWLAGLAGCGLATVALRRRRTLLAGCLLAVALGVATSGAVLAMQAFVHPPWERLYEGQPLAAYDPSCVERSIPVCVHPAYEASLEDSADRVGRLVEPLLGVPGGPVRAEQLPERAGLRSDGTLEIMPGPSAVGRAAYDLVREQGVEFNPAQLAIAYWLLERVGEQNFLAQGLLGVGQPDAAVTAAVARFAALTPEAQRAWLEANYAALRAGELSLADLP